MCGILGIVNIKNREKVTIGLVKKLTNLMKHRGPDDFGFFSEDSIGFGHRRLSILDLSKKGNQPMQDRDKNIVITFNGEIYNYLEIREELLKKGYKFNSNTDTEVVINAYKEWGIKSLKRFNGMFAFALHDKKEKTTYIIRDRLGIKPLFYAFFDGRIIFASEIKSIVNFPKFKKSPNYKAISSYLSYRYVLGKETLFENVFKLEPGSYMRIYDGFVNVIKYYELPRKIKKISYVEAKNKVHDLLFDSVKKRMISDVPLGAYLSGGLDSSILVGMMASIDKSRIKTYTIGFKGGEFNEFEHSDIVAKMHNTQNKKIILNASTYLNTMKKLIKVKDLPLGVPNEVPLYLMSKELKKDITVVMSGEGADEIFSGYGRLFRSPFDYYRLNFVKLLPNFLRQFFFKSLMQKYKGRFFSSQQDHFLYSYNYFPLEEKNNLFNSFMKKEVKSDYYTNNLFKSEFKKLSNLSYYNKIPYIFERFHLPGLLARVDNSTMATSVEARVPFVDHRLVEFALTLPVSFKMVWNSFTDSFKGFFLSSSEISEHLDQTKFILRDACSKYIPKHTLKRKKVGFPVPLHQWFTGDFIAYTKKMLLSQKSMIRKVIDPKKLNSWIDFNQKNPEMDKQFGQKLWMFLNIEIWMKHNFNKL